MLTILLPVWTWWTLAVLVSVAWLWGWALCRAAALGDERIHAARSVGDAGAELLLTPQRAEAATASATIGFGVGQDEVRGFLDDERLDHRELFRVS